LICLHGIEMVQSGQTGKIKGTVQLNLCRLRCCVTYLDHHGGLSRWLARGICGYIAYDVGIALVRLVEARTRWFVTYILCLTQSRRSYQEKFAYQQGRGSREMVIDHFIFLRLYE